MNTSKMVFDLGAHHGEDSLYYLRKGYRVIAVEANPNCADRIRATFAAEISSGHLTLVQAALWHRGDRKIPFYVNQRVSVWGTVVPSWAERNKKLGANSDAIQVRTITIPQLLKQFGIPYYIKIDIEGFDLAVLRQLARYATSHREFTSCRYLSWESSKTRLADLVEEYDLADQMGFRKFAIVPQHLISGLAPALIKRRGKPITHPWAAGSSGPFGKGLSQAYLERLDSIQLYQNIFFKYQLYGDSSALPERFNKRMATSLTREIEKHFGPAGWYDTHAAR